MKKTVLLMIVCFVLASAVSARGFNILNTYFKYEKPAVFQENVLNIDLVNPSGQKRSGQVEVTVSGPGFKNYKMYSRYHNVSPKSMKSLKVPWRAAKAAEYTFEIEVEGEVLARTVMKVGIRTDAFKPVMLNDPPEGFKMLVEQTMQNVKATDPRESVDHYFEEVRSVGDKRKFWTVNMTNNQFETVETTLKAIGKHCYVFVEDGQEIDPVHIEKLQNAFDVNVYPKDTYYFGSEPNPGVDKDEKVVLLMLDIKDNFEKTGGFVGGYFSPMNQFKEADLQAYNPSLHSNECEMFFLDVNPGDPKNTEKMAGVISHEFQHMIHFNNDPKSETWLNEACSQLATYVSGYGHPTNLGSFLKDNIEDSLTLWNGGAIDYGPVYLWLFYIVENYTPDKDTKHKFLNSIVAVPNKKNRAVKVLNMIFENFKIPGFKKVFSDYVTALAINDEKFQDGIYSFRGKIDINKFGPIEMLVKRSINTGEFKKTLSEWSQAFVRFSLKDPSANSELVTPKKPLFSDKLVFTSPKPGILVWGVNYWETPDESYWPAGSEKRKSGAVQSPLIETSDKNYICELGPFNGNKKYDRIDFTFIYEDGTWLKNYEILEFATPENTHEIDFSNYVVSLESEESKDFMLRILKKGFRGQEIETYTSSGGAITVGLKGYGDTFDEMDFMIMNFESPEDADFTLKVKPAVSGGSSGNTEALGSDLDISIEGGLGSDIDINIQNLVGSDLDVSMKKKIGSDIDIQIENILYVEEKSRTDAMQNASLNQKIASFAKYMVALSMKLKIEDFRVYVGKLNRLKVRDKIYHAIRLNVDRINYSLDRKSECMELLRNTLQSR